MQTVRKEGKYVKSNEEYTLFSNIFWKIICPLSSVSIFCISLTLGIDLGLMSIKYELNWAINSVSNCLNEIPFLLNYI